MDGGVQEIAAHIDETWTSLLAAVKDVDDALLQWCPGSEFNSVAILLRHLAGSDRWWIGEGIGGVASRRVRAAEFQHDTPRRDDLLRTVDEARSLTRRVLSGLTMQDLQAETSPAVTVGTPPRRPTKLWALLHFLEHLGYHRGQVLLLLKLGRAAMSKASAR